jgi:DNA-binding MarR family transcriptional regulator
MQNSPAAAAPALPRLPLDVVHHVAGTCLCLHTQRAARALARRFDAALKPLGLTHGQYSLMMALNWPQPPTIGTVADFLAMDRTSLTAALKPLERRGLVAIRPDPQDGRARRLGLTEAGVMTLTAAVPVWRDTHAALEGALPEGAPERMRADLRAVVAIPPSPSMAAS